MARVGVSGCGHEETLILIWNLDIKNAAFITSDFTEFIYMDSVSLSLPSYVCVFANP